MCEFCNLAHDTCPLVVVLLTIAGLGLLAIIIAAIAGICEYFSELNRERYYTRNDIKALERSIARLNAKVDGLERITTPVDEQEPQSEKDNGHSVCVGKCRVKIRVR